MQKFLSYLVLFTAMGMWASPVCCQTLSPQTPEQQALGAMQILNQWHQADPVVGRKQLHIICWTPSDRKFPADHNARLTRIMTHIRDFYGREIKRLGLGQRTFNLQFEDNGQLKIHSIRGRQPEKHYHKQSGSEIRGECLVHLKSMDSNFDPEQETMVIFCNLATWDEKNLTFEHNSPYYAGGNFRKGTAYQLDSPELDIPNIKKIQPMIRDGQYGRISLGKHNSIFIGGIAHELGHALGLPHNRERPDEAVRGTALMGAGNQTYGEEIRGESRGSFLTLAHGLRLASHPQFSGSEKGLNESGQSSVSTLRFDLKDSTVTVAGKVSGSPPIYALVGYFDPMGHDDYDATTVTAVPDERGNFVFQWASSIENTRGVLRLYPLHVNGFVKRKTDFQYPFSVDAQGKPDFSTAKLLLDLEPVVEAIRSNDPVSMDRLVAGLKTEKARAIAGNLMMPRLRTIAPADHVHEAGNPTSVPLTRFKPERATVGWMKPRYDRLPGDQPLLLSGGQLFETGIYAHAKSRHVYRLGKRWKSLVGQAGMVDGKSGSVQFEILADGKSIWKSKEIKQDQVTTFKVDVANTEQLELLVHPASNSTYSDWGVWLEPTLHWQDID